MNERGQKPNEAFEVNGRLCRKPSAVCARWGVGNTCFTSVGSDLSVDPDEYSGVLLSVDIRDFQTHSEKIRIKVRWMRA